ncbi:unnamed protein product, partial [Discosporangium mesarthrocarpum]
MGGDGDEAEGSLGRGRRRGRVRAPSRLSYKSLGAQEADLDNFSDEDGDDEDDDEDDDDDNDDKGQYQEGGEAHAVRACPGASLGTSPALGLHSPGSGGVSGRKRRLWPGPSPGGRKRAKAKGPRRLGIKEARALEQALLSFGLGRWEEVRAAAGLDPDRAPLPWVVRYGGEMLRIAASGVEDPALGEQMRHSLEHLVTPLLPPQPPDGPTAAMAEAGIAPPIPPLHAHDTHTPVTAPTVTLGPDVFRVEGAGLNPSVCGFMIPQAGKDRFRTEADRALETAVSAAAAAAAAAVA